MVYQFKCIISDRLSDRVLLRLRYQLKAACFLIHRDLLNFNWQEWVAQSTTDGTIIARRYGRWMPSANKEAGEKAVAIFAKKMLAECCHSDPK